MKNKLLSILVGLLTPIAVSTQATAAWTFSDADLVLGFQAGSGMGSTTNLFFNLGNSFTWNTNHTPYGLVGNISDDLTATYGSGWANRTDLYFGVFGNRTNLSAASSPAGPTQDAGRTVYVSTPTVNLGTASLRPQQSSTSLATPTGQYANLRTNLSTFTETVNLDGVASLVQSASPVEWTNSWTVRVPIAGQAFGNLGNIQNTFSPSTGVSSLDIQRMTPGTATTYAGSLSIYDNGNIVLIPEPSTSLLGVAAAGLLVFRRRRNG